MIPSKKPAPVITLTLVLATLLALPVIPRAGEKETRDSSGTEENEKKKGPAKRKGDEEKEKRTGRRESRKKNHRGKKLGKKILPRKVLLPEMGIYRAPTILRLAGKLTGLPVKVAYKHLNDVKVAIPRTFHRRHVNLKELRTVLALSSLYLVEWAHPRRGRLLVATNRGDWKPEEPEHRKVIQVKPRVHARVVEVLRDEIDRRNMKLRPGKKPYVIVPAPRQGKIFLWGSSREGLEKLAHLAAQVKAVDVDRPRLHSYMVRYRRAELLADALLDELSEGEKNRTRVSVGAWRNVILYKTTEDIAKRIETILEGLDVPSKRKRSQETSTTRS